MHVRVKQELAELIHGVSNKKINHMIKNSSTKTGTKIEARKAIKAMRRYSSKAVHLETSWVAHVDPDFTLLQSFFELRHEKTHCHLRLADKVHVLCQSD